VRPLEARAVAVDVLRRQVDDGVDPREGALEERLVSQVAAQRLHPRKRLAEVVGEEGVQGPWRLVLRKISETLSVYPEVKGIQVMNDEGKYMFSSYAGKWIPDSPAARRNIISRLANWNPYSDSSPVEGIAEAISTFYEPGKPISIFVFGDDFPRGQVEAVARFVDRVNKVDADGNRLVRIHGVGFPTQLAGGRMRNAQQFANLMRTLCERNGGSFVALTYLN